jgi:hypothetical protein
MTSIVAEATTCAFVSTKAVVGDDHARASRTEDSVLLDSPVWIDDRRLGLAQGDWMSSPLPVAAAPDDGDRCAGRRRAPRR